MKILFSPSEGKSKINTHTCLNEKSFIFSRLYDKRLGVITQYKNFIKECDENILEKFFGIKGKDELYNLSQDILKKDTT
ncbi:peroxide stress protein YaaA, partial [Campylobacter lari]|nr:peroxide stress protein YaaA [Campylobacter lari]